MPRETEEQEAPKAGIARRREIASKLVAGGFPVMAAARFAGVEPSEFVGGNSGPESDMRDDLVAEAFSMLDRRFGGRFMLMYRVWTKEDQWGISLSWLLSARAATPSAIERQLAFLAPEIARIEAAIAA